MKKLSTILLAIISFILLLPFAIIYAIFRFIESFYDYYLLIKDTILEVENEQ